MKKYKIVREEHISFDNFVVYEKGFFWKRLYLYGVMTEKDANEFIRINSKLKLTCEKRTKLAMDQGWRDIYWNKDLKYWCGKRTIWGIWDKISSDEELIKNK